MPHIDIAVRAYAVTLRGQGLSCKEVEKMAGVKSAQLSRIVKKAKERGWKKGDICLSTHVEDRSRSGRPRQIEGEVAERMIAVVTQNNTSRGQHSTLEIAKQLETPFPGFPEGVKVSVNTVRRYLKRQGFKNVKKNNPPSTTNNTPNNTNNSKSGPAAAVVTAAAPQDADSSTAKKIWTISESQAERNRKTKLNAARIPPIVE